VRDVASTVLGLRKAQGLRVRLPLGSVTVAAPDADRLAPFTAILTDELNVKRVHLTTDVETVASHVLQVVPAVCGPRLGPETQTVIRAVKAGQWEERDGVVIAGGIALEAGEYTLRLVPQDEERSATLPGNRGVVVLDTEVTPELEAEGLARDLVRVVQNARKAAGLHVSDRVRLRVDVPDAVRPVLAALTAMVAAETLATEVDWGEVPAGFAGEVGDAVAVRVEVERA